MEEKTSHFVQLDDGTYAEMVEGHEMVAPGHQMLVEDQDGQKLVVVNPAPGDEPQTIVVPEQAETVYVIGDSISLSSDTTYNDCLQPLRMSLALLLLRVRTMISRGC